MKELFGVMAVFDTPDAVKRAAASLRDSGLRRFEAYTPYPIEGLDHIIHPGPQLFLPLLMFVAAVLGAAWGYWIQYWDEALNYPLNVGGRPYNSWPAFVVATFEFMLLASVAAGFFGLLAKSKLPKLYHPVFEADAFERASRDRFVICVEASDPAFDPASVRSAFERLGAETIEEVRA
jgi:ActD protein